MENKNGLTTFESAAFGNLRTALDEKNNPLFCLKDACSILEIKNPSDVKKRLDSKGIIKLDNPESKKAGKLLFVSEGNLYRLIFQSRKEEAEGFWKEQGYTYFETSAKTGDNIDETIKFLVKKVIDIKEGNIDEEKDKNENIKIDKNKENKDKNEDAKKCGC